MIFVERAEGAIVENAIGVKEYADRGDEVAILPAWPVETLLPPITCQGASGRASMMRSC